ncbi:MULTISPECIES: ATP synthase F1 subcomplex subunit epsilon [Holospora]|uniref:F0F1 ATP synthase subunit epsilon n=2 Tax=Holospora TaxID=44747 RepID=A0A061JGD2_9PROT|nr:MULTISPECIES: ATP synthase F1 subcomplex subunit epsilon [Holospora]ETZ05015.1 F0F1 ATP synthase subunit epsilon [Holospora undulata HU1]GAJ45820.1 F0F1 ATP synthase subunit epsilon [Holospora elegans E1]
MNNSHSVTSSFRVTLKHFNQIVYSGSVLRIIVPTSCGRFEISSGHCTLFQVIDSGWIEVWAEEESTALKFLCTGGVIEMLNNHAVLDAFHLVEAHQHQQVEALLKNLHTLYHEQ